MIRTEKEAASCVCPIIERTQDGGVCYCVSSKCMAWRWATDVDLFKESGRGEEGMARIKEANHCGFCGLAGQP